MSGGTGDGVDGVFAASAAERRALADVLERLDDAQLATPSLCRGWDVRTVAAHLASAVLPAKGAFVLALLRSGLRPHVANDREARRLASRPFPEVVAALRAHADSRFAPPVVGPRGPLTDALVHAADVLVPLGLPHDPSPQAVRLALEFVTTGRPVGFVPRGRLAGLQLVADDLGWSWGRGDRVAGRGIDVLVAACGRPAVLDRLLGPGCAPLRRRLPA